MTRTKRQELGRTDAATLLTGAASGDEASFDGLFRRYGPEAWRFSSGVSGDDVVARYAVTDGFASSVVAARDGIITHPGGFRRSLLHATRLRVAERDDPSTPGHASSTEAIAPAFASLPELMRSVLWLEHVHQLRPTRIAEVTGVPAAEVRDLSRRAHQAVAVHHLDAQARVADDPCASALRGSARSLGRRLPVGDRAAVRSHVSSCSSCRAIVALAKDLDSTLPPLASALPEHLLDESRAAWLAAITPPSPMGLSPMVEKVLAAASATAAVVAIVGAAYWRGNSSGTSVAVSPVLHQVGGPIPEFDGLDLDSPLDLPEVTPDTDGGTGGAAPDATETTTSSDSNGTSTGTGTRTAAKAAPDSTTGLSGGSPTVSPNAGTPTGGNTGQSGSGSTGGTTNPPPPTGGGGTTTPEAPAPEAPAPTTSGPLLTLTLGGTSLDLGGSNVVSVTSAPNTAPLIQTGDALTALDPVVDAVNSLTGGLLGG